VIEIKDPDEDFWTSRGNLEIIREVSRSRLLSEWAVLGCCLVREQSSLKAFLYITRNWKQVMAKRREIMSRKRVDDDYIASWFRYDPVSSPANKTKTSARAMAKSKAARG